jgi:hypothetical protein
MNKPIDTAELFPAEPVKERAEPQADNLPSVSDDFCWGSDNDSIIIPHQPAIAVYFNPPGEVVIRQEGHYHPDEDHWIYIQIENLDPLIAKLQRIARREIEPA